MTHRKHKCVTNPSDSNMHDNDIRNSKIKHILPMSSGRAMSLDKLFCIKFFITNLVPHYNDKMTTHPKPKFQTT